MGSKAKKKTKEKFEGKDSTNKASAKNLSKLWLALVFITGDLLT